MAMAMTMEHLTAHLKKSPIILENIVQALPRNEKTRQELSELVEEIQNVQHRYIECDSKGPPGEPAVAVNNEGEARDEPVFDIRSKAIASEEGLRNKEQWSEEYHKILHPTNPHVEDLRRFLGSSLNQIDSLIIHTLPDPIGKQELRKFYGDIRMISAKYYGDHIGEEFPSTESNSDDEEISDIQKKKNGILEPRGNEQSQIRGSGMPPFIVSDDCLIELQEHQTATGDCSSAEVNIESARIDSSSGLVGGSCRRRLFVDCLVNRPHLSESSCQNRAANRQMGQDMSNYKGSLSDTSTSMQEISSPIILDHKEGSSDGFHARTMAEHSPGLISLLRNTPQLLKSSQDNPTTLEEQDSALIHPTEVNFTPKRKRTEMDTGEKGAKFQKIDDGRLEIRPSSSGIDQIYPNSDLTGSIQTGQLGRKIMSAKRSVQLNLAERVRRHMSQRDQDLGWLPRAESDSESPTPRSQKALDHPDLKQPTFHRAMKEHEPLSSETLSFRRQEFAEKQKTSSLDPISGVESHRCSSSISGHDEEEHPGNTITLSEAVVRIKRKQRKQRKQKSAVIKKGNSPSKAQDLESVHTNGEMGSETVAFTMEDTPSQKICSLLNSQNDSFGIQILCSDSELRPRGDEDGPMLKFVDWEHIEQRKPGDGGFFNPVELYSKFQRLKIDSIVLGNRFMSTNQAMKLVNIVSGIGSPCVFAQFRDIGVVMREELVVDREFILGTEYFGRAALKLSLGPDEGPFKAFAESVLALQFFRYLENARAIHGEMLPLTARDFDHKKIQELEARSCPKRYRTMDLRKLREIGYRFAMLAEIYGDGILALIPSTGRFGDCVREIADMHGLVFKFLHGYMTKNQDSFLLKVSRSLESYVQKGMWDTLTLPKLRLEVEGMFDESNLRERSDQLVLMCLPV